MTQNFRPQECPIPGCHRSRGADKLMCFPHWQQVPKDLQRRVYRTYRTYRETVYSSPTYSKIHAEYEQAVSDAMYAAKGGKP